MRRAFLLLKYESVFPAGEWGGQKSKILMMADYEEAAIVKQQYEQKWMAMEEVAAIGIGKAGEETGIIISVTEHPEKVRREIPSRIEGVPIQIKKTGPFNVQ